MRGGLCPWSEVESSSTLSSREFDRAFRQQVEHERLAARYGRAMRAARLIDHPARAMTVEKRCAFERHHEVDFTVGMSMMRSDHVVHLDDVDRKSMRRNARLHDAAVTNAARFAIAYPSFRDAGAACVLHIAKDRARGCANRIEVRLERAIE